MALPNNYDPKEYLPTEQDFADVFAAKQNGKYYKLPYYPLGKDEPYYYPTIRIYLTAILLKWEELARQIENKLLEGKYEWINGNKQLVPYYTKQDLAIIRSFAIQYKQHYIDAYMKYKDKGQNLESPEKLRNQARDARKGEIQVNIKNPNGGFFRILEYSMKYGEDDPNKKQSGARMHLYINEKVTANTWGISIRGSNTFGSNRTELDEPFFATEQEARNFIANIDKQHIPTRVSLEDWRFVISDRPIDYAWDQATRKYIKKSDLKGAKRINTICGPCYMLDKCRFFESLEEKDMNEAIEKHNELNQKIFDGDKLKPEVRAKAEEVVNEFLRILAEDEVKLVVRDVILTGSNASYNYTKDSDIDLHILAKTVDLNDPDKLYPKIYNCYRRLFESKFNISFYGVPVEVYVETEDNPVVSNGIYSVMFDKWVKYPEPGYVPEVDQAKIDAEAKPWIARAKALIKKVDDNMPDGEEAIDLFLSDIYEMRQRGIYEAEGGEFSTENLVFKEVRNAGLLDRIKELKNKVIEKKLTLEEGIKYLDDDHEFKDYGTEEADGKDVINVHKGSTFGTQDLLDGSIDSKYDGVCYTIINLTPTQYFELCGKVQDMKPEEIIDFISRDEQQIAHIKDVILKFNKKLPLPYVSFSSIDEVSGQEGRHRMYALGEMFGWDEEFPVMVVQDSSTKKTVGELLNEAVMKDFQLDEKTRREYVVKIAQIAHDQPIVHPNGIFELHNISEQDANFIIPNLRRMPWVEYISKAGGRYDYSKMSYQGIPALKLNITGKIKIN